MSWWGTHPQKHISKADARKALAPGACKACVYFYRVYERYRDRYCPNCGLGHPVSIQLWQSEVFIVATDARTWWRDCIYRRYSTATEPYRMK